MALGHSFFLKVHYATLSYRDQRTGSVEPQNNQKTEAVNMHQVYGITGLCGLGLDAHLL
jgi:hypothetical protein